MTHIEVVTDVYRVIEVLTGQPGPRGARGDDATATVPVEIDGKADITYVDDALDGKADITYVDAALADKADTGHTHLLSDITDHEAPAPVDLSGYVTDAELSSALASKADTVVVGFELDTKVSHAELNAGLATKADSTTVDAALALKASSAHTHVLADITNYQATPGAGGGLPSPTLPVGVAGNRVILFPSSNVNNRRASENPATLILTPGYLPYPLSLASITLEVTNPVDLTATLFYCTVAGEGADLAWTPVILGTFHAGSTGAKTMTGPFTIPAGIAWWGIKGLGVGYLSSAEQGIVGPVTNYTGSTANLGANNCALEISTTALTPFTRAEIYSPWYDVRLPWLQGVLA